MTKRRLMRIGSAVVGLIVVVGIVAFIASYFFSDTVSTDDPIVADETNESAEDNLLKFPILTGTNLELREQAIPADLNGELQLIVVAYTVDQQPAVEAWLPHLEDLNADYPDLAGYYVPILPKDTADSALFIIGGMALSASGEKDRQRTIVVFTDVDAFNDVLELDGIDEIRLFLINAASDVIWAENGEFTPEKLTDLANTLATLE